MMTPSLPGRVNRPALLSTLWIFLLLNLIFRDIHEFLRPGFLHEAMTGTLNGTELTDELFLVAGILLEVPIAMVLLSRVLPIRPNRWANISAAIIALGIVVGGSPQDMDDMFFAVVEAITLGAVVLVAWTWRTPLDPVTAPQPAA